MFFAHQIARERKSDLVSRQLLGIAGPFCTTLRAASVARHVFLDVSKALSSGLLCGGPIAFAQRSRSRVKKRNNDGQKSSRQIFQVCQKLEGVTRMEPQKKAENRK